MKSRLTAIFLISAVISVNVNADDSQKNEFIRRSKIVASLAELYKEYEEVDEQQGANESKPILDEFLSKFKRQFDKSDNWLYYALTDENGVLDQTIEDSKYHYEKVKKFLNASSNVINTALDIHHMYERHLGTLSKMKKIESFRATVNEQLKQLTYKTLKYMEEEAWKEQFILDIDDLVQKHGSEQSLHLQILTMLKDKYPFRSWFVMIRNVNDHWRNFVCPLGDEPAYEEYIGDWNWNGRDWNKKLIVLQVKANGRRSKNYPQQILDNIWDSRNFWKCIQSHSKEIYRESRYRCYSQQLSFFAVLDEKEGHPQYAASDRSMVLSKTVTRSTWNGDCRRRFKVILFG